jgi:hypothetical protein
MLAENSAFKELYAAHTNGDDIQAPTNKWNRTKIARREAAVSSNWDNSGPSSKR